MNKFKVGDLVKTCSIDYPHYNKRATCGILMEHHSPQRWIVFISGRIHPYLIEERSMIPSKKWLESDRFWHADIWSTSFKNRKKRTRMYFPKRPIGGSAASTSFDYRPNKRVECASGFSMSVQASEFHYSRPRTNYAASYSLVEIGMPSSPEPLLEQYAEDPSSLTKTVFPFVPRQLVVDIICKHGGIISGELPAGIPYVRFNDWCRLSLPITHNFSTHIFFFPSHNTDTT